MALFYLESRDNGRQTSTDLGVTPENAKYWRRVDAAITYVTQMVRDAADDPDAAPYHREYLERLTKKNQSKKIRLSIVHEYLTRHNIKLLV